MKKVSIITSTYNHAEYIGQCIESVLAQTYQNWEQIIIDDGSTDGTREVIQKYQDPRIRYYYQKNKGIFRLGETYNRALNLAQGELIAILEGDDFWPPDKLEALVPTFDDPEIVLAYGFTRLVTAKGREVAFNIPTSQFLKKFPNSVLFNDPIGSAACVMARSDVRTFAFPCSVIIRRETLEKIGGFQSVSGLPFVDYPTFINLSLRGKYFFIPRIMGYWRQHIRSNTQTRNEERTASHLRDFALKFIAHHQAILPLSSSERYTIEQTWKYISVESAFIQGRRFLLMKQWEKARLKFQKALNEEKRIKRRIAAIVGYCASLFHFDIEWCYSLIKGRSSNLKKFLIPDPKNKRVKDF